MQKLIIATILVLIPFGTMGQDRYGSFSKPDGKMWETWTKMASGDMPMFIKAAYVQGVVSGLTAGSAVGYYSGRIDEKNDALNYMKPCLEKGQPCSGIPIANLIKPVEKYASDEFDTGLNKIQSNFTAQHTSMFDIVHQVDKFYADYRNTPVCMVAAVQEAISSLNGNASSEEALNMERKGCNQ